MAKNLVDNIRVLEELGEGGDFICDVKEHRDTSDYILIRPYPDEWHISFCTSAELYKAYHDKEGHVHIPLEELDAPIVVFAIEHAIKILEG